MQLIFKNNNKKNNGLPLFYMIVFILNSFFFSSESIIGVNKIIRKKIQLKLRLILEPLILIN